MRENTDQNNSEYDTFNAVIRMLSKISSCIYFGITVNVLSISGQFLQFTPPVTFVYNIWFSGAFRGIRGVLEVYNVIVMIKYYRTFDLGFI